MDQLINFVTEKTGLNPDQARKAANAVVSFLKDKLPAGVSTQIDSLISGKQTGTAGTPGLDDLKGKLGGMKGNK